MLGEADTCLSLGTGQAASLGGEEDAGRCLSSMIKCLLCSGIVCNSSGSGVVMGDTGIPCCRTSVREPGREGENCEIGTTYRHTGLSRPCFLWGSDKLMVCQQERLPQKGRGGL